MLIWRPTHQFSKSLRDFLYRIPGLLVGVSGTSPPAPRIPFVIRLGAAGPLQLRGKNEGLAVAVNEMLSALKKYADEFANPKFHQMMFSDGSAPPPAQLRLFCQLAAGFDQMAGSVALAMGYKLHIVLPGSRAAFRQDIQRNSNGGSPGVPQNRGPRLTSSEAGAQGLEAERLAEGGSIGTNDSVSQFDQLLTAAERVMELDRDDESSDESPFTLSDYAQAGSIVLDNSDAVLVVVHDEPSPAIGGTRWIEQRAEERDLPLIRVPVERPFDSLLIWTVDGRREQRRLFEAGSTKADPHLFAAALDDRLLGAPFDLSSTRFGGLERRMIASLDPEFNAKEWTKRWELDSSDALARHDLGPAPQQIDNDLKPIKVWADQRASAMAELMRGSFIVSALLGVVAVLGALVGIVFPGGGEAGKRLEVVCLIVIFWLIWRSRRYDWRSQWLSSRALDRFAEQASWLLLLGRCRVYAISSHPAQLQTDDIATWTNAYFRGVIRNSSFPTAHFTPDYLKTVHALALQNLVVGQIAYFQEEAPFQQKSDEVLRRGTMKCVSLAFAVTIAYLLQPTHLRILRPLSDATPSEIAAVLGALLTTAAAALSSIRSHGEYAQLAARFESARESLQAIQGQLVARLPDRRPDFSPRPLRSASLASIVGAATDILFQEVQEWRAILQTKEIEPT
jgi:hypothetical protein